jgi:hypothetical protein
VIVTYTESLFGTAFANVKALRTGPSSAFHWPGNIITASSVLSGKVRKQAILEGVYGNSIMTWRDDRSGNGDIFAQMIKFDGEAGVCTVVLKAGIEGFWNGTSQVSDTVKCYLRSSSSPYTIVESARAVLDTNGEGLVSFPSAPAGTYYLVVTHRNSIETWSAFPLTLVKGYNPYDFTTSASQAYGNNTVLKSGRYCNYSGDVNQDGVVDGADGGLADNDAFNFVTGYVSTDVNGDLSTDASDLAIVDNNSFNFVGVVRP